MANPINIARTTLSQNFGGFLNELAPNAAKFYRDDVPDQSGKVAVITGGTEGIGYGCTYTLLAKNISKIFLLSPSSEAADKAKESIQEEMDEDMRLRMHWLPCDLADWKRVADVADQVKKETDRVDILINNGARGIMTYQLSELGVDRHMAVNHIGHVILTSHLLPLLKKTASSGDKVRISNQASNAHQNAPKDTKFASLDELNQDIGPMALYGRAKLANILYSRYLARHLASSHPNILVNATHPGIVQTKMSATDIHEPYPKAGYVMSVGLKPFKKDQFEGALSTLFAATKTEKSGEYICPPADPETGSELAQDEELGEQLMRLTRELVREKLGGESVDKGCPLTDY